MSCTIAHLGDPFREEISRQGGFLLVYSGGSMNKETLKTFLRWLENASDEELDSKREEIQNNFSRVSRDGAADLKLALRLLDEEILVRLVIKQRGDRAGSSVG
jgi:hypothetical protein